MVLRPEAGTIPDTPGSYQFYDKDSRIIYVGKAKSLRSRVNSYFAKTSSLHPRTAQMVASAHRVEWIQVDTNVEALMLEFNLIKKHRPRFNVRLVDDKSYPYLAVTVSDIWPRAKVIRGKKRKGIRYFGPYAHAYAIRSTLDLLLRSFQLRSCSDAKLKRHEKLKKPCLLFHIEKCSGPCVGEVTKEKYKEMVDDLCKFLEGDTDEIVERVSKEMQQAAEDLDFEWAARLRDRLAAIERSTEKQQMVGDRDEDFDIIGLAEDDLEAAIYVFYVRRGRVTGQRSFILDKVENLNEKELMEKVIEGLYTATDETPPKTVLIPKEISETKLYQDWLSLERGSQVKIRVPKRGDKVTLQKTVTQNAVEEFRRHRLRRASDHNSRAKALNELQKWLKLERAPLRIECYDMSHLSGTNYVGSMVVVEDGLAKTSEYRRFKVTEVDGSDDYAAMEEVLTRRFQRYVEDRVKPVSERGKFQYPPNLLMVDGGKGQLSVAIRVLKKFDLFDEIAVCSLAKQFEEVYVPSSKQPIVIDRQSEALYLLQRLRDESHRFAIEYHRKLRDKEMKKSVLDDIAGLGPARKKRLLEEVGSITKIKRAELSELEALTWLPNDVALAIYNQFH